MAGSRPSGRWPRAGCAPEGGEVDTGSRFVLHSLRRDPCLTLVRGENARLWDADGRMYLDTMSGSAGPAMVGQDRKSTRLNSSHPSISYAVFCLKKKNNKRQ